MTNLHSEVSWTDSVVGVSESGLVGPFAERGAIASFYANGGTAAQYAEIMCGYYAAYSKVSRSGLARANMDKGAGTVAPVSESGSVVDALESRKKVSEWACNAVGGVDPPGCPVADYDAISSSKKPIVESLGDGYCYLYAVRLEFVERVALACGPDCKFRDLLGFYEWFESDAYLATLRVEVNGLSGHVSPYSDRGTRFLTLCRALKPGFAPEEFERRMAKYKVSCAGFASDDAFTLGSANAAWEAESSDDLHDREAFNRKWGDVVAYVPDAVDGNAHLLEFTRHETCKGYLGLICENQVGRRLVLKAPDGFQRGFLRCPVGASVLSGGTMVEGPCAVYIEPGVQFQLEHVSDVTGLWFDVLTHGRPDGVLPRVPPYASLGRRVARVLALLDSDVQSYVGSVALGRSNDVVVKMPVYHDGTQGSKAVRYVQSYLDKVAPGKMMSVMSASMDAIKLIWSMSHGGMAVISLVYPNGVSADAVQDSVAIKGLTGYSLGSTLVIGSKQVHGMMLHLVSAEYKRDDIHVVYECRDKESGSVVWRFPVVYELRDYDCDKLAVLGGLFSPSSMPQVA